MALLNFQDLNNTIAEWLNRTDLGAIIPDFITLAEADIRVDLRSRGTTLLATISIDDASQTLPTDVKIVRSLYDAWGPIRLVAPEEIARVRKLYPSGATRADYAAIVSGYLPATATTITALTLLPAPIPQAAVTATIIYEPELPALTVDATTNWLMTKMPTIYLYGALKHSAPFLRDDERLPVWDKLYGDAIAKLDRMRNDIEFGAGPLVAMPRNSFD